LILHSPISAPDPCEIRRQNFFVQKLVNLRRDPKIKDILAITWSAGSYGTVGQDNLGTIRTEIKGLIDVFINDFLSVNPKGEK